jgi:hypothetical protein
LYALRRDSKIAASRHSASGLSSTDSSPIHHPRHEAVISSQSIKSSETQHSSVACWEILLFLQKSQNNVSAAHLDRMRTALLAAPGDPQRIRPNQLNQRFSFQV